jgi:hypothetical protein
MSNWNKKVPKRQPTITTNEISSARNDVESMTDDSLWRAFVATHRKLVTIERIEHLITDLKAVEAARSEHTKELATIEHIERLVAELNTAIAATSDRYVREGHRRG